MTDFPRSLIEFQRRFPDEEACAAYLAAARWPDGSRCPACGHAKGWELAGKPFTSECAGCGRQTSVTAGTVMHGSKLAITIWFWAAYLMATHSNGISARQLQEQLGLGSYKTAWLLCAKLRRAMRAPDRNPLAGIVEADETTIPYRTCEDPVAGGAGRSGEAKMRIAGAVEVADNRPGRVRLAAIKDFSATARLRQGQRRPRDDRPDRRLVRLCRRPQPGPRSHTVGPMVAHVVLPWVHRVFVNLKCWAAVIVAACIGTQYCWAANLQPVQSLLEMRQNKVVVQKWDLSCGAAALATIITYKFGDSVSERDIAKALISRKEYIENPEFLKIRQGFSLLDLKRYVDGRGYQGMGFGKLTFADLIEKAPIMVPVDFLGYNHFVVFLGRMEDRVLLADPGWGNRTMLRGKFEDAWIDYGEAMGKVGFVVERHGTVPPNQLRPKASDFVMLR